jgi:hypothetical protein
MAASPIESTPREVEPPDPPDQQSAEDWRWTMLALADETLASIPDTDRDHRRVIACADRVRQATGAGLVALFREHRDRHAQMTAWMIHVARLHAARQQRRLATWIAGGLDGAF